MDLQTYLQRRQELANKAKTYRELCDRCVQPKFSCYCSHIRRFDPCIKFVVLIHPIEVRRRIATGRMTHLTLENSELIMGQDYSDNCDVNSIIENPANDCWVLYPGRQSLNLTECRSESRSELFNSQKQPVIFVIDGTWATAKKMMRQSLNLAKLRRICFTPPTPSRFRVRKQPGVECYSTIEAVHHCIELVGQSAGYDVSSRTHDALLYVFDKMVERQLSFIKEARLRPRESMYRPPKSHFSL